MSLVESIVAYLEQRRVPSALIGGVALAVHGIARATLDTDLLVVDRSVLDPSFWTDCRVCEKHEIRCGDADDPLAGVVRCTQEDQVVDVVVGKHEWQRRILERRVSVTIEGHSLPAVSRADLVLLKLFAAGPQDLLDIRLLLAADAGALRREVEQRLPELPSSMQAAWRSLNETPRSG